MKNKELTPEEFLKSKFNDWNGITYLGFYEDTQVNVCELLKEYAQAKVKEDREELEKKIESSRRITCDNPYCSSDDIIELLNRNKRMCQICGHKWKFKTTS